MTVKDYKCKCGHDDFFFADKGNQKGIYCSYCGKWFKWADKDEQNLRMKQAYVLDKIRDEITAITINGQVDEHTMFVRSGEQVKRMALDVIDKYKAERSE